MNMTGPIGPPLKDIEWVRRVADEYGLHGMSIPLGSVVLDNTTAVGGRTFCYEDGTWSIGISRARFRIVGKEGMKGIMAHELLHAWLWCMHEFVGHGDVFIEQAQSRNIPIHCSTFDDVKEMAPRQVALL